MNILFKDDIEVIGDTQKRHIIIINTRSVTPCPICKNESKMIVSSKKLGDYRYEMWVQCQCGYTPRSKNHLTICESTTGDLNAENTINAVASWNMKIYFNYIAEQKTEEYNEH